MKLAAVTATAVVTQARARGLLFVPTGFSFSSWLWLLVVSSAEDGAGRADVAAIATADRNSCRRCVADLLFGRDDLGPVRRPVGGGGDSERDGREPGGRSGDEQADGW